MSTNISKQKREDLLAKIKEIRTFISAAPQDENTGNLLSYLSNLEKDVNGKKYGLVFEEHREEIDEVLDTHTPVLTEDKDLFIDNGGQMNFVIEGDNLASLKLLEKTHKGKIDLIYIDPPYNTGNKDFIYDDAYIDNNDCYRHSKWISFLIQRLKIARNLLTQDGVIFMSIDDNEQAELRMIADYIFGEHNFISEMIWQKKKGGSMILDMLLLNMNIFLCIQKTKSYLIIFLLLMVKNMLLVIRRKMKKGGSFGILSKENQVNSIMQLLVQMVQSLKKMKMENLFHGCVQKNVFFQI